MGQARARGTYEERVAQAQERQWNENRDKLEAAYQAQEARREAELKRKEAQAQVIEDDAAVVGSEARIRRGGKSRISSMLAAGIAAMVMSPTPNAPRK